MAQKLCFAGLPSSRLIIIRRCHSWGSSPISRATRLITPRFIIGFSGHRTLSQPALITPAIETALVELARLARDRHHGEVEFFSSIACGADTLAVETARRLKLPVHIVIPKPIESHDESRQLSLDDGFAADFWQDGNLQQEDWDRAWTQIQDARQGTDGGTLRLVRGAQTSPECYYDAGVQVLDVSDAVIAVWDGRPSGGLGGTADIVEIARIRQLPLLLIDAQTGVITRERLDRFATPDDAGCAILERLQHHVMERHPDLSRKSPSVAQRFPVSGSEAERLLAETAVSMADDFRDALVRIIRGHGIATAVAAIAAVAADIRGVKALPWILAGLAFIEFLFVLRATLRQWRLHHGHVHEAWMQTRFAAEIIRGQKDAGRLLDPLAPLIARHHPNWRRFALATGLDLYRSGLADQTWERQRDAYISTRLGVQIGYFRKNQAAASRVFHRAAAWGTALGKAAAMFVLGALVYKVLKALHWIDPKGGFVVLNVICFTLLPILLPLSVSLALSLRNALDAGRRTYRYAEMVQRLEEAAAVIQTLKTASSVRRAVAATEEILIDELNEWHLAEKQNEAH